MATSAFASSSSSTAWQNLVRQRLEERDVRERAFDQIIENYQRLLRYAKQQYDRNTSLLTAAGAVKSASTSAVTGTGASAAPGIKSADNSDDAVKQAYIVSLESQLQGMRDELATLYKTQSQNAQRLLLLNEQLRDRDEKEREAGDSSRRTVDELVRLRRKEEDLRGAMIEKDKMIQLLQDELSALSLELNQVELRNDHLKRDNASLLQRWLDRMNEEADRMNEGNQFLQEVDKRRGDSFGEKDARDPDATVRAP